MDHAALNELTIDLNTGVPRSPRDTVGGYVVAARTLDKCRAAITGKLGEYHFDCPLDRLFFDFTGLAADDFQAFVATGADDAAVGEWITEHAKPRDREEVVQWNNDLRGKRLCEMPIELQLFLEDYIPQCLPVGRIVHCWFDVYDIEEGRI